MVYATIRLTVRFTVCLLDNRIVDIVYLINLKLLLLDFNRRLPVRHLEDFLQIQIELLA